MKEFVFPILVIFGGLAVGAARHVVTPLSVPTAPAVNRVAVPAANDPSSNPSDGAARNTTVTASSSVAVVSLTPDIAPQPLTKAPDIAEQMLSENNRIRAAAGKPPQTLDERLCRAAQDQADYMARYHRPVIQNGVFTSPSYSHDTNGGSRARLARAGFPWTDYAENLNLSTPGHPDDSWQSWRNSAPHYGSMLRPFPLAGFGQATARDGSIYSAALYGTESSAAIAPREQTFSVSQPARTVPQIPRRQISQQPYLILPPVDRHPPPLVHSTQTYSSCGPQGCPPRIFRRGR